MIIWILVLLFKPRHALGIICVKNGVFPMMLAQAIQNLQISIFGINIVYSS